jgi:hypothetical protein
MVNSTRKESHRRQYIRAGPQHQPDCSGPSIPTNGLSTCGGTGRGGRCRVSGRSPTKARTQSANIFVSMTSIWRAHGSARRAFYFIGWPRSKTANGGTSHEGTHPRTQPRQVGDRHRDAHITPLLGNLMLNKKQAAQISAAYTKALESGRRNGEGGLSPRTVHHMHRVLKQALGRTVKWELLQRNPCDAVDRPRSSGRHRSPTTLTRRSTYSKRYGPPACSSRPCWGCSAA